MFGTVIVLGLAGYSYNRYYKWLILHKMERAFRPGDPALELAGPSSGCMDAEARHKHVDEQDHEHRLELTLNRRGLMRLWLVLRGDVTTC